MQLSDKDAVAVLAASDMPRATRFYEETLGFVPASRMGDELVNYRSGNTAFTVYRSDFAGSNKATALCWSVGLDEIEGLMQALRAKGVTFEHYDLPDTRREGDLHVGDGMKVAWFKDPDGNLLNLVAG